jgi:hypothetical protein
LLRREKVQPGRFFQKIVSKIKNLRKCDELLHRSACGFGATPHSSRRGARAEAGTPDIPD